LSVVCVNQQQQQILIFKFKILDRDVEFYVLQPFSF